MKKIIPGAVIMAILILAVIVGFRVWSPEDTWLCQDGAWVKHGNPKQSQPKTSCAVTKSALSEAEARLIAEKECIKGGEALVAGIYNDNSKTWWFDANLNATREGCSPACVVSEETKKAEINWRCTGLINP